MGNLRKWRNKLRARLRRWAFGSLGFAEATITVRSALPGTEISVAISVDLATLHVRANWTVPDCVLDAERKRLADRARRLREN